MKIPSLKSVALALVPVRADAVAIKRAAAPDANEEMWWIEVRLQVCEDGKWHLHTGCDQYDQDHTGYWGYDYVGPESDLAEVARTLIEEVQDQVYIHGS